MLPMTNTTGIVQGYYKLENQHLRDRLLSLIKEKKELEARITAIESVIAYNEEQINQLMLELTNG